MKNKVDHFRPEGKRGSDSKRHRRTHYLLGGGRLLLPGVFVAVSRLPVLVAGFLKTRFRKRKPRVKSETIDEEGNRAIFLIISQDFYMRDFATEEMAAEHLGIPVEKLVSIMDAWDTSLYDFIHEMRIEEVKLRLRAYPGESLEEIACACGFDSEAQLLYHFYKCEKCLPGMWISGNLKK